ncbi:alpha/beta hydrolase fold domain-containing protein [Altererythrobacter salegens]|uniref:Alpha/beta hydrolase fold domain-containing protein n=1 Tax=Croceibacterium salegens TaxID=1737568 RepID=A0A6I4SWB3_9SPHN|nr:alpha/beta hydrolase [Croceibacterium salegens]MXO60414.1 alpha/beta hydrolase fold domain-containing protein [Croceibacterium salegens]
MSLRVAAFISLGLTAVVALGVVGTYFWAVRSQSVATLDWLDQQFPRTVATLPPVSAAYGSDPHQVVVVYRPAGMSNPPLVAFIHGGGWRNGSPDDYGFVARAFAQRGYATALVGYRLNGTGRFPAMLEDSAAAVRWLLDHADELGVSTDKLLLSGHSAGAYNAVMLSLDRQWLEREDVPEGTVKGVAGLAGPYDFYPWDSDYSRAAFGAWPNPRQTQPIDFARGDAPPMLLVTGDADETVKPRNSQAIAARQQELGARAEVLVLSGYSHAGTLTHIARPFDRDSREIDAIMAFFDSIAHNTASAAVQPAKR